MDNERLLEIAKDSVRYKLLKVYQDMGLQCALDMSDQFLGEAAKAGKELGIDDFGKIIRGELSELYAEMCMREYVREHTNSFYTKSLCFPRTDGKEGFTELDLTLFTQYFILVLECKSYSGSKTLTDEGCMNVKGRTSYNVFAQNRMHLANLDPYIRNHRLLTVKDAGKPYIIGMFSYSKDDITDLRDNEWRNKFLLLTEKNILQYLNSIVRNKVIWDIHGLYGTVSKLEKRSKDCMIKHIEMSKRSRGEI